MLFEEYAKQYREYSKANKASSSHSRDRFSINNLKKSFKGMYLFDITTEMIEKYKTARLKKVEPATVNRELASSSTCTPRPLNGAT